MKKTKLQFANMPKDYAGLCRILMPRPIRDSADYDKVVAVTDEMAGHNLNRDQDDYFDLLCQLIEAYEEAHPAMKLPQASGLDCLRHLLEEHKQGAADLARLLGVHRSLGGMILRGERRLTVGHIRALAKHFCVSGDLFLDAGEHRKAA